jgi:hypothetical protein
MRSLELLLGESRDHGEIVWSTRARPTGDARGHDRPGEQSELEDLQTVLGTRGDPSRCHCQRYKMQPGESWASVGAEELAFRLRTQTECGHLESGTTSGLVAYLDGDPVGWCAVEPRTAYPRLLLKTRVPGQVETRTRPRPASGR